MLDLCSHLLKETPKKDFCSIHSGSLSLVMLFRPSFSTEFVYSKMVLHSPSQSNIRSADVASRPPPRTGCTNRLNSTLTGYLESAFFSYGRTITHKPTHFILFCLVFTALCSIGLVNFTREKKWHKLWVPKDSKTVKTMDWQEDYFSPGYRSNFALWEAENVLEKDVLLEMLRVHDLIAQTRTNLATWESVCFKVPTFSSPLFGRKRKSVIEKDNPTLNTSRVNEPLLPSIVRQTRQAGHTGDDDDVAGTDWTAWLSRDQYCEILTSLKQVCHERSILEVFGYDHDVISSLTQEQIINRINTIKTSVVTGFLINVAGLLGKAERDVNGQIIKAGASMHSWTMKTKRTAAEQGKYAHDTAKRTNIDNDISEWEHSFLENIMNDSERPNNITVYPIGSSSITTVSENAIHGHMQYLGFSFAVAFIYILIMLGKFNRVEQRPLLSFFGLSCVGLALAVSCGICSAFSVPYGPVNNVVPYLLLGLGIDDMFVIMQAWNNLTPAERQQGLAERVGCALRRAGVSITVTSMTDCCAFAVGSITVLPALRYFCIYAAVGIAFVYFFQVTFFVACLSIDQRRLENHRPALFCCWKLKNWTPNKCSQKNLCQRFFSEVYSKFLLLPAVKVIVLLVTVFLTCISGWGLYNLQVKEDPHSLIPQDSYVYKYIEKRDYYYPSPSNAHGSIYFRNINFTADLRKIGDLTALLKNSVYIAAVDSWYDTYKRYWKKQGYDVPDPNQTEDEILDQLSQFLHSPAGSLYRYRDFYFPSAPNCTDRAPSLTGFKINYKHKIITTSREEQQAVDSVSETIRDMNFSGDARASSITYLHWERNWVIKDELYRNMAVVMIIVMLVTCILVTSVVTSFLVMTCVMLTLVDVAALIHWWGLTIDTASYVNLVITIGLSVDYGAHVGHTFMTMVGSRDQRATSTLATIGPAVLNSGITTFLSFVFLANSVSHVFITFFKVSRLISHFIIL